MSTSAPQPDLSDTEELVAYLDGELSADASRRVEQRLSHDADYRRQLSELDQAWSALEALPPTAVNDDFARTTIEMVAVAAEHDQTKQSAQLSAQRRRRTLVGAAICVLFAAAAFATARTLLSRTNNALVADLPVIAQLDVLEEIDDVEFLRGLTTLGIERYLDNEVTLARSNEPAAATDDWETLAGRRAWIERLSGEEQAQLDARFRRFGSRSPDDQQHLRTLLSTIADADDRAGLQATMTAYARWLGRRTPGEQAELRAMTTEERLRRVERLARQSDRDARRQLSFEDERALQEAILRFVERRRPELEQELRSQGLPNPRRHIEGRSMAEIALGIIVREWHRDDDRRDRIQDRLTAQLSPSAQEYLDSLPGRERSHLLWRWMFESLRPRFGPRELERFFAEDLDNDQRAYLLGLPKSEMEEQLQRLYVGSQVGLRVRDWPGEFGPPGRPDRDGSGRRPRDRDRGPGDRDRRNGPPPRNPDDRRFERGPIDRPPDGPPPEFDEGGPDRGRFRRGPDGPPPDGPPPEGPL